MDDLSKEIIGQTGEVAKEAYKDLVRPSAKPIGIMISLLPRTIRLGLQKWEKWIINGEESLMLTAAALQEKVKDIPEDKQCEPEPYVAIPAIQQIPYCTDSDELRNMYANLLASSMNIDKKWSVHPGYVDIIKQMTPDEARIMKKTAQINELYNPIVDVIVNLGIGKGDFEIYRNYSTIAESVCENAKYMGQYFDNLYRLRLIDIPEDRHIINDGRYDDIRKSEFIQKYLNSKCDDGITVELRKKYFYITDFGKDFLSCCLYE